MVRARDRRRVRRPVTFRRSARPSASGTISAASIQEAALFVCATVGYTTGTILFRERATLAHLRHLPCCLSARARRACRGGGGCCGFRPGGTARRGLSGILRLEDARLFVLRAGRRERAAAHGRFRPGGSRRHRTVSQPWTSRAGPRAHDGRALVCGNQRHGPHHDAAAVRRHAHRRGACASRGARVRATEPGSEPLRHDHALRQPAEPVSVLVLWAAPRRFPAHDGVALRAVDRWRRRLHLVAVRPLGLQ